MLLSTISLLVVPFVRMGKIFSKAKRKGGAGAGGGGTKTPRAFAAAAASCCFFFVATYCYAAFFSVLMSSPPSPKGGTTIMGTTTSSAAGDGGQQLPGDGKEDEYTTNAHDQQEAAKLKERLRRENEEQEQKHKSAGGGSANFRRVPNVQLAAGKWKYVQISATEPGSAEPQLFVTSKKGVRYHRQAAEPVVEQLRRAGYTNIEIKGGGRIQLDPKSRTMKIYGFSYTFGRVNHDDAIKVVKNDPKYADYVITTSDEGY